MMDAIEGALVEKMLVIIDYGMGNMRSVLHKVRKLGVDGVASSNLEEIASADKLILPGVGHFSKGMSNIHSEYPHCTTKTLTKLCANDNINSTRGYYCQFR